MRPLFFGLALAVLTAASPAAAADGPFTRAELIAYLKQNIPYWAEPDYDAACERAAETVRTRGISFSYDGSFDQELHQAGACPPVLAAMRAGRRPAAAAPTGPAAGNKASPAQAARAEAPVRAAAAQSGTVRPCRYLIFS